MGKIIIDEDEFKTHVDRYFESTKRFTEKEAKILLQKYDNSIKKLSEDLTGIKTENQKLLIDTIYYFAKTSEDKLKEIIDESKKIKDTGKSSMATLFTNLHQAIEIDTAITNIYIADVVLNENKLFPDDVIDKLYDLQTEAERLATEAIAKITKDELIERSYNIKTMARQLSLEVQDKGGIEAQEYHSVQTVYTRHPYYAIKALAFEESYLTPAVFEEQPTWQQMNYKLFEVEMSKDDIIRNILMPINSFEKQVEFINYLLKEQEAYYPIREKNMKEVIMAIADIAEYRMSQMIAKIACLTEEDNLKATMLKQCKQTHDFITTKFQQIDFKYRCVYHPKEYDATSVARDKVDNASLIFRTSYDTQRCLFQDIKELSKEQRKFHEELRKKFPISLMKNQENPEYRELWDKIREIDLEIQTALDKYKTEENRSREIDI